MPYRRLPNTDAARLRALEAAIEKGKKIAPTNLAYKYNYLHKLEMLTPKFEKAIKESDAKLKEQAKISELYRENKHKAKLYVSHFVQVLNMCILREEMPLKTRALYKLPLEETKVPTISKDEDLIDLAKNLMEGEAKRTQSGETPIFNPRMSFVKIHVEKFVTAMNKYRKAQTAYQNAQNQVQSLRPEVDELILTIWNEVEEHFESLSDQQRLKKLSDYGIVFFERKKQQEEEV
jgi:hypothetical protein